MIDVNPQRIILTFKGEEVGCAYGLENVYRAYQFVEHDAWRYEDTRLPGWITDEAWAAMVEAKRRLERVEPPISMIARGTTGDGCDDVV